jgi:hypothetical protein
MSTDDVWSNRRQTDDRRAPSWRTLISGHRHARRRDLRRSEDASSAFVDWYHPWLLFLALGSMVLSCLDAFLTLELLQRGMIEANPLMALLLRQGTAVFAVSKIAMTGISIIILVLCSRIQFMNYLPTGLLLTALFSVYCCLVCYQVVNLLHLS